MIDDAVDDGFPAECAKMLRDIICRKKHELFLLATRHDPLVRVEHMIVWLQRSARVVRGNRPSHRTPLLWNAATLPQPPPGDDDDRRRTWPGKGWRRRRAPGPRCRACSFTQMGLHRKNSNRCGVRCGEEGRIHTVVCFYVCNYFLVSGILRYTFVFF